MWFALACHGLNSNPSVDPADDAALRGVLLAPLSGGPLNLRPKPAHLEPGYSVRPVRFSLQPGFDISGALWSPDSPAELGVLVAHGHYGQGKSSPEAQEIAHRLAARGYTVLAVDTPGVEEWDVTGRHIHFREGAHNRAFLAAGETSALALQLAVLRRGLDVLTAQGARRIVATGASGGAVLSFYLQLIDSRIEGSVLAAFPRIPREARAGGCPCDQIPGWPGPDPGVLAALEGPSLWLSDVPRERPVGLPGHVGFAVVEGPHSYTREMQDRAIRWIDDRLGGPSAPIRDAVPLLSIDAGAPEPGAMRIMDLQLSPTTRWTPGAAPVVPYTVACTGPGPSIVVGGGDAADVAALHAAGLRACVVDLVTGEPGGWSALDLEEAVSRGPPLVDRYAGAMSKAAVKTAAVGAWGSRAWGLAAAGAGVPFVVRDPVRTLDQVKPMEDPPWIHVPGAWWGATTAVLASAVASGADRTELARALQAKATPQSP